MGTQRNGLAEYQHPWRRSMFMGVAASVFSLMLGIFIQTAVYEIAHYLPAIYRQDAHISLPLCNLFPELYGCDPWVGALTGLEIWELSIRVGQISGLLINLVLILVLSTLLTLRAGRNESKAGVFIGINGFISSLTLALLFNVPLNTHSPQGIFGILCLLFLPLSGFVGGRIGKRRLARYPSLRSMNFLTGDEGIQFGLGGESLSKRELEVLALVAEGCKNSEIAKRLYISKATVKTHLQHIFAKLGVKNRTAAVTQALAYGLLRQEVGEEKP